MILRRSPIILDRMLLASLILQAAAPSAAHLMAAYRERVVATVRCRSAASDEVVVCARRAADRFRVPLKVAPTPGDPRREGVHEERDRLLTSRNNCAEKSAFLVGCGHVGVSVSTRTGFTLDGGERELAP